MTDTKAVKIEEVVSGLRWFYEYEEPTLMGERLVVEMLRCENPGGASSLPELWKKHGYTLTVLVDWWSVHVYAYDDKGNCLGRYNPIEKLNEDGTRNVIDFDWLLQATDDNREKILREIERRAF